MNVNLSKIDIRKVGNTWRVWIPKACAPWETTKDEHGFMQVEWGDFYFDWYDHALIFARFVISEVRTWWERLVSYLEASNA